MATNHEAILNRAPPSAVRLNPDLPPKLEEIISRALEKDRDLRYQSASDLRAELKRVKRDTESGRSPAVSEPVLAPSVRAAGGPSSGYTQAVATTSGSGIAAVKPSSRLRGYWFVGAAALVLVLGIAAGRFFLHQRPALTAKDSILLTDFVNTTGDSVFDDTLKKALAVDLEQSPYLNVFPDQKIRQTLKFMGRSADERINSETAREICQRNGIKAMLNGSIASVGEQYVIAIDAVNAATGDSLAKVDAQSANKSQVLQALGTAAGQLREKLGESLPSIQRFDKPLTEATTASLEALRAFTLGEQQRAAGNELASIPFYQRAVELDPNFALAYARLGTIYSNTGQLDLSAQYQQKAFDLKDRASERERLYIVSHYYADYRGDIEKGLASWELYRHTYPNDSTPLSNLGGLYMFKGQFDKAVQLGKEGIRLEENANNYTTAAGGYVGLNRLEEAKSVLNTAVQRGMTGTSIFSTLSQIALAQGDEASRRKYDSILTGDVEGQLFLLQRDAALEAKAGRLLEALQLLRRAKDTAERNGAKEVAANALASVALYDAAFEKRAGAKKSAEGALVMSRSSPSVIPNVAFALAMASDDKRAECIIGNLAHRRPQDTFINSVAVPVVQAISYIHRNAPEQAVQALNAATPFERGILLVPYTRGAAFSQARQAKSAAAEFEKVLAMRNLAPQDPILAFSQLGLARAYAGAGDIAKARTAYQDLFSLWKDADPDIPILQAAKAEYAKLQ